MSNFQFIYKCIFPVKFKLANVTPVFKIGDKGELTNYRPISVLTIFSKILERIAYIGIFKFLDKDNIISQSQYGFRRCYLTYLAIIDLTNRIIDAVENNSHAFGVFVDLSKAFDTINHQKL